MKRWIAGAAAGLCLMLPLTVQATGDMTDEEYEAVYGKKPPVEVSAKVKSDAPKEKKEDRKAELPAVKESVAPAEKPAAEANSAAPAEKPAAEANGTAPAEKPAAEANSAVPVEKPAGEKSQLEADTAEALRKAELAETEAGEAQLKAQKAKERAEEARAEVAALRAAQTVEREAALQDAKKETEAARLETETVKKELEQLKREAEAAKKQAAELKQEADESRQAAEAARRETESARREAEAAREKAEAVKPEEETAGNQEPAEKETAVGTAGVKEAAKESAEEIVEYVPPQEKTKRATKGGKSAKKREATRNRFRRIFADQNFVYYIDTKNMCWIPCPNTTDQIIDAWIKLVSISEYNEGGDTGAALTPNYFLEHYYIYPRRQQIQFLCEMEVKGRPLNNVKERIYSPGHWENLVPGSIEDTIFHAVMDNVDEMPKNGRRSGMKSIGDGIEDVLHIAL